MEKDLGIIRFELGKTETLHDIFLKRVSESGGDIAYRYFEKNAQIWQQISWLGMAELVKNHADILVGLGAKAGDRCAILSENSPYWIAADQAALSLGMITVPLFYNDRPENMVHVMQDAGTRFLVVSTREHWQELEPEVGSTQLQVVMLADSFAVIWQSPNPQAAVHDAQIPANLATIIYTSGTTGKPKGVMLTHENIIKNACGAYTVSNVYASDLFLSFLPLSHAFERTVGYYLPMMTGAKVAYARSVLTLAEDLLTISPTIIITVPRMFEKINDRLNEKLATASAFKRGLVGLAERVGYHHFQMQQHLAGWGFSELLFPLLDKMVGSKVRASLGGRLRLAVSGGAPLSFAIAKRYLGFGVRILQGYGLTECSPVVCSNRLAHNWPDSVGWVLPDTEVQVDKHSGELLVRGHGIMLGYWQHPEATAAVIDHEGWFHTGDIAKIQQKHIYITGRIKDILVMSNGEKVPPTDVEEALLKDPWIDQVMVVGEGKPYLTALVVLSHLGAKATKAMLLKRITKDMHAFPGYEKVKDIMICPEPWTVDGGMLTPTMKLRRDFVFAQFADAIEAMYH